MSASSPPATQIAALARGRGKSVVGERDIERWFADQQTSRARRREVCASKRWFATEAEARAAALWDRTQFGEALTCYRCEECDGWHLTGGRGRPRG